MNLQRYRCEECDYDLCGACFVPVEAAEDKVRSPEESSDDEFNLPRARRRTTVRPPWSVRGRAFFPRGGAKARPRRSRPKEDDWALEAADEGSQASGSQAATAAPSVEAPSKSSETLQNTPDAEETDDWPASQREQGPPERPSNKDDAPEEPAENPRTDVHRHLLPLHFAVRCGNVGTVASLLELGAVPTEAAFRELVKLPSASLRREMEETIAPYLDRVGKGSLPLFARIAFGRPSEYPIRFDTALGTLPLMALRRRSAEVRDSYGRELRQLLGEEWFEAAEREALTQELREELLLALQQRRLPDEALVTELLVAGADMQAAPPNCSDGESNHDGEGGEDDKPPESEDSSHQEHHDGSSTRWCPAPKQAQSCAELIAMQGECTEEMIHWVFPPPGGSSSSQPPRPLPLWRRQRLLAISLWSGNVALAKAALSGFAEDEGLDSIVWHALRLMTEASEKRKDVEVAFRDFIAARGLHKVEVPLWALIQLGRCKQRGQPSRRDAKVSAYLRDRDTTGAELAEMADFLGLPPPPLSASLHSADATTVEIAVEMHGEAIVHMEAVLAAEDASSVPMDVLAGIHKCLDRPTREVFQGMLNRRFINFPDRGGKMQKRSSRAATRLLLWELRRAFCERRTPDLALAAHLLESGARTRPREEDTSDEDEEPDGHPGGARYATDYDDAPRNSLDLLALNRFADPQKLQVAIKKACEYKADPKQYSSYERPLALAVRSRNVAAVHALLDVGAPVDRQALSALQLISDRGCRQVIEERFLTVVSSGSCSLCMKDVALWVLVQSGNVKALRRRLKSEQSDVTVDATVMMGLRRCRKSLCTQELRELLVERFGASSVSSFEAQAATAELAMELREALIDQRGPDEETVSELVNLGANVQAKNVDLDSYVEDEETDDDAVDQESGSESED